MSEQKESLEVRFARVETALDLHLKECSENWKRVEGFMGTVIKTIIAGSGSIIITLACALGWLAYHTHV